MLQNIAFLFLGAMLGAIFGMLLPTLTEKCQNRYQLRKKSIRDVAFDNKRLVTWIRDFHDYHWDNFGIPNELSFCEIGGYCERVPYLSKKEWNPPDNISELPQIDIYEDTILRFAKTSTKGFPVDPTLIKQRIKWGQYVWDAETLYLDHISLENSLPVFHVKTCQYFANATNMFRLEDETVKAVRKNRFDNCPIRKKYYLRTDGIENNLYMPITIGCLIVFALRFDEGYRILIQTRSSKTATSNGVKSISPTFGLSPFIGQPPEKLSLLYYNFLREYLEELHYIQEVRELDKEQLSPRTANSYYSFLYGMERAKKVTDCPDFNLYYIGFGFNLTNGNPNIGLLAKLDDTSISRAILDSIFCNWEVAKISVVDVHSDELGKLFSEGEFDPASSFFLSRALRYLQ